VVRLILRARNAEQEIARTRTVATAAGGTEGRVVTSSQRNAKSGESRRETDELSAFKQGLGPFVNLAHDLRSSLCTVTVVSSWILGEYSDRMDASGREYLALLQKSVERMTALIDSTLPARSRARGA
jgi:light-regulated signal transduction histidine kinase (bacteriophytochrome)